MWEKRQILLIFAICKKQIDEYIMMEDYKKEDFDRLKNEVETLVGRKIVSPRDFDFLSRQIEGYTQESVSVSTLKRMWGYVACSCKPSKFNLELLDRKSVV